MSNRLAAESSPYLRQHAANPVDWYPWGPEAFAASAKRQVPLLVSIGYSACHWCHVMEHESFSDADTAAVMNELFVNVKVDREERPDVDAVYMDAVVSLTGQGGWPLTVFLLPDRRPFFGGTYFPPTPRMGMPSWRQVLEAVNDAYRRRGDAVERQAAALTAALNAAAAAAPPLLDSGVLGQAVEELAGQFDARNGGFGGAPKFPPSSLVGTLLDLGDQSTSRGMAIQTLDAMMRGGIHDQLGGGFHRYSVDAAWRIPHFEKMLYDNALLARAYARSGLDRHAEVARRTLAYIERELLVGDGLASAQDADTDGAEGATFVWSAQEIRALLDPADARLISARYGVSDEGNFEGRTVLAVVRDAPDAAAEAGIAADDAPQRLHAAEAALLAVRNRRPQPALDDKRLAAWNGLALAAFADASRRLDDDALLDRGRRLASFLLTERVDDDGRLWRTERQPGFADDYGAVADGLIALHEASGELRWLMEARRLTLAAVELFGAEDGSFYLAPSDGEELIARRRDLDDSPTPSATSLLAGNLLRIGRVFADPALEQRALRAVRASQSLMARAPQAFGHMLGVLAAALRAPREVVIIGPPPHPATRALRRTVTDHLPGLSVLVISDPSDPLLSEVPLGAGRGLVSGAPAVYVCERSVCAAPVTTPEQVAALLADAAG